MEKKLPKVFANKVNKEFNNNKKVFYSNQNDSETLVRNEKKEMKNTYEKNIYQKINDIFNSERYVYKAEVNIKTKTDNIKTKIIGQNSTHLITIDNQLIPITEIEDINYIN